MYRGHVHRRSIVTTIRAAHCRPLLVALAASLPVACRLRRCGKGSDAAPGKVSSGRGTGKDGGQSVVGPDDSGTATVDSMTARLATRGSGRRTDAGRVVGDPTGVTAVPIDRFSTRSERAPTWRRRRRGRRRAHGHGVRWAAQPPGRRQSRRREGLDLDAPERGRPCVSC